MSNQCKFQIAWVGQCKEETISDNDMCPKHALKTCVSCGKPATHECDSTGQFVCGAPLCDDCEHTICEDGTNGGVGFYKTSKLPDGYREHCKKSEQVYTLWYMR